jgi:hypothetical protein
MGPLEVRAAPISGVPFTRTALAGGDRIAGILDRGRVAALAESGGGTLGRVAGELAGRAAAVGVGRVVSRVANATAVGRVIRAGIDLLEPCELGGPVVDEIAAAVPGEVTITGMTILNPRLLLRDERENRELEAFKTLYSAAFDRDVAIRRKRRDDRSKQPAATERGAERGSAATPGGDPREKEPEKRPEEPKKGAAPTAEPAPAVRSTTTAAPKAEPAKAAAKRAPPAKDPDSWVQDGKRVQFGGDEKQADRAFRHLKEEERLSPQEISRVRQAIRDDMRGVDVRRMKAREGDFREITVDGRIVEYSRYKYDSDVINIGRIIIKKS